MSALQTNTTVNKLIISILSMIALLTVAWFHAPSASALTSSELQTKAEKACGKGNSVKEKACRNGFREGYQGTSSSDACGSGRDKDYPTKAEKTACQSGHTKGKALKASTSGEGGNTIKEDTKRDQCGKGENAVKTKFNFGCVGNDYKGDSLNPIMDVVYTIARFLSAGVGIILVGSIIWAGIMYSSSQGNPEQTRAAKNRIQNAIIGLFIYMFIFAIIQYLVPGGLFT